MSKYESTKASSRNAEHEASSGMKGAIARNWRSITVMAAIVCIALFLRVFFAYDVSVGSGYALSGGADASYQLGLVEQMVKGQFPTSDHTYYYPFYTVNPYPPMLTIIAAGLAEVFILAGFDTATACSAGLAWTAPIVGSLACLTVYLLGRELFKSKVAGLLAAFFYAICPLAITETVFSNGTEASLILLFVPLMAFFAVKGLRALESSDGEGLFASNKKAFVNAFLAAVVFALIELSWNGFRPILVLFVAIMAIQVLLDRFRGSDPRPAALFYGIIIGVGTAIALPYYVYAELWSLVFSGPAVIAAVSVVICIAYAFLKDHTWVLTLPICIAALAVVFALMYFFAPDLFSATVNGNTLYTNTLFASLMTATAPSVSTLSTYFGWATMWFGWIVVAYMIYRLPRNVSSPVFLFTFAWLAGSLIISWISDAAAIATAAAYAVGSSALVVLILKRVQIRDYFSSFKGADVKSVWKRIFKPVPFVTVIVAILLLAAPNLMYAVDASIPSNDKGEYNDSISEARDYLGSIDYFVKSDDSWLVNDVFETYKSSMSATSDNVIVTWNDYATDAVTYGGFRSVVDTMGNGSEAMANILLSSGSDNGVVAALAIYLTMYRGLDDCRLLYVDSASSGYGSLTAAEYDEFKAAFDDISGCRDKILADPDKYGAVSSGVSDTNVTFIYGVNYLTDHMSGYEIAELYDSLRNFTEKKISYFAINGSMLAKMYGDGSVLNAMAYLNGYEIDSTYGAATEFFSYYYGYYSLTDSMYDTFLWRALIGQLPEEVSSSTNQYNSAINWYNYMAQLTLSDGTVVPTPCTGLSNFVIDKWYVHYNPDDDANLNSDGWVVMERADAVAKQDAEGGLINYLSDLPIIIRYVPNTGSYVDGSVTLHTGENVEGVQVSVYDADGVRRATTYTDSDGSYALKMPSVTAGCTIRFAYGTDNISGGIELQVSNYSGTSSYDCQLSADITVEGTVTLGDVAYTQASHVKFTGQMSGEVYEDDTSSGVFELTSADKVVPDTYDVVVTDAQGNELGTSKVTLRVGENNGLKIEIGKTVTVTVYEEYNALCRDITPDKIELVSKSTGISYYGTGTNDNGKVTVHVPAGAYSVKVKDDASRIEATDVSVDVTSGTTGTATVYALVKSTVSITGLTANAAVSIYSTAYSATATADGSGAATVDLPYGVSGNPVYSYYSKVGTNVRMGTFSLNNTTMTVPATSEVTGSLVTIDLNGKSGADASGTVVFIAPNGTSIATQVRDGAATIRLPDLTYTVYAYGDNKSYAYIGQRTVSGDQTITIDMVESRTVNSTVSWYSTGSSNYMMFLPTELEYDIDSSTTVKLYGTTGVDGKAVFYLPKETTAEIKTTLRSNCGMYFSSYTVSYGTSYGNYTPCVSTVSSVSSTATYSYVLAYADPVNVTNSSAHDISVNGVFIASGATASVVPTANTATVTITPSASESCLYSATVPIEPNVALTMTDAMLTSDGTIYTVNDVTITGVPSDASVEVTGDGYTSQNNEKKASLSAITYETASSGKRAVVGFSSTTNMYTVNLPVGTAHNATVDVTAFLTDPLSTVTYGYSLDSSGDLKLNAGSGIATITVMSADGNIANVYTISFRIDSTASINSFAYKVGSGTETSVSTQSGVYTYEIKLPTATGNDDNIVITTATLNTSSSTSVIGASTKLGTGGQGQTTITVTTVGGLEQIYTIKFLRGGDGTGVPYNTGLSSLSYTLGGTTSTLNITGASDYYVISTKGFTVGGAISVTPVAINGVVKNIADETVTSINGSIAVSGSTDLQFKICAGGSETIYTVHFRYVGGLTNDDLSKIGFTVSGMSKRYVDVTKFVSNAMTVTLPYGTAPNADITFSDVSTVDSGATVTYSSVKLINGTASAEFKVKPQSGSEVTYTVTFTVDTTDRYYAEVGDYTIRVTDADDKAYIVNTNAATDVTVPVAPSASVVYNEVGKLTLFVGTNNSGTAVVSYDTDGLGGDDVFIRYENTSGDSIWELEDVPLVTVNVYATYMQTVDSVDHCYTTPIRSVAPVSGEFPARTNLVGLTAEIVSAECTDETSGTYTVSFDISKDIWSAGYSVIAGSGWASTGTMPTIRNDNQVITYTMTGTLSGEMEASLILLDINGVQVQEISVDFSAISDFSATVDSYTAGSADEVTFGVTVEGDGSTLSLSGGTAWSSVRFYQGANLITSVTPDSSGESITIKGTIDKSAIATNDENLSVIFSDAAGEAVLTTPLTGGDWNGSGDIKLSRGSDIVTEGAYLYVLNIENTTAVKKTVTYSATMSVAAGDDWYYTYVTDGYTNYSFGDVQTVEVDGYSTLSVAVKVTQLGSSADIPKATFNVTGTGLVSGDDTINVASGGASATSDQYNSIPVAMTVGAMTASGTGLYDTLGEMPVIVWVLLALCILMIIATVWLGFKRGLFSRRK